MISFLLFVKILFLYEVIFIGMGVRIFICGEYKLIFNSF